jgi:hypothetical protein
MDRLRLNLSLVVRELCDRVRLATFRFSNVITGVRGYLFDLHLPKKSILNRLLHSK